MSEFVLGVLCTLWLIATVIILVVVWQLPEVLDFEHHLIVGHVGGDVTLRYTQSGVAVASFSLAVNDRRNKDAPPTWYRVTCWRQLAEFANEYVRKGAPLLVSGGRLVQSEWQTDAGEKRTSLELTADAVTLLGSKADADEGGAEAGERFPF